MMNRIVRGLLVAAALAAGAGCVGAPEDYEGATGSSVAVPAGTQPLARIGSSAWLMVADSCEDRIPGEVEFRLVREGVVVALDSRGMPVCTDEVEDVQAELVESGRVAESRALGDSYLVAVGIGVPIQPGDPSPQPSTEACEGVQGAGSSHGSIREAPEDEVQPGDPSPQPSTQPTQCRTQTPGI